MIANDNIDVWSLDEVHFPQYGSRCQMWVPPEVKSWYCCIIQREGVSDILEQYEFEMESLFTKEKMTRLMAIHFGLFSNVSGRPVAMHKERYT